MHRFPLRRPSPSMAVALIALFISLGGVSYGFATGSIDSREIKNNTIRTRDIRNSEVRGRDIRNSTIRSADVALNTLTGFDINESKLGKVPSAGSADAATRSGTATVGLSPVAYARVNSSGNVLEAYSRGVGDANLSSGGTGRYCFRGLTFAFRSAQVTIDYGDSATGGNLDRIAQVAKGDPQGDCGTGNQLEVATSNGSGAAGAGFYVWFFA
jgi:hypothetical protein